MKARSWSLLASAAVTIAWWLASPHELSSHGALMTTVLFDREIVRILNSRCVMCHSDGSLSFPLSTYEQTWVRGRAIRGEILRRHMPPWAAVPGYGEFANANHLTLRETQFIVSWVEGLGPRNAGNLFLNVGGAPRTAAEVRAVAHTTHWQLGEPDLRREVSPIVVNANDSDTVRKTVIELGLTSERRIRGLEFMPTDRRVIRAAVFTLESTGQWLGAWTPWYGFTTLPAGVVHRLPAGSRVVAELHYRGTTEGVEAGGTLGLFFADRQATRVASDIVLTARTTAPSGDGSARLMATTRVSIDTNVWALYMNVQRGLSSIEVWARRPDGGTDVLLYARNPSTQWPTPYIFKAPRVLRRGTELAVVAYFDKAAAAPAGVPLTVSRY